MASPCAYNQHNHNQIAATTGWFPCTAQTFLEYGCDAGLKATYHAAARADEDVVITEWEPAGLPDAAAATGVALGELTRAYERICTFNAVGIPFPAAIASVVGTNTVGMTERQLLVFTRDGKFFTQADFGPNLMATFFNARVVFRVVDDAAAGAALLMDPEVASGVQSTTQLEALRAEAGVPGIVVEAHCRISFSMPLLGSVFEVFIIGLATSSASMYMKYFREWLAAPDDRPVVPLPHIYGELRPIPPALSTSLASDASALSAASAATLYHDTTQTMDGDTSLVESDDGDAAAASQRDPLAAMAALVARLEARLHAALARVDELSAMVDAHTRASSAAAPASSSSSFQRSIRANPGAPRSRVAAASNPSSFSLAAFVMDALQLATSLLGRILRILRSIPSLVVYFVPTLVTLLFTILRWRITLARV
ncbi:uncharacterized protein AMSG_09967 [Thecamonas trahens ATCC 50062]|uniref:VASt domain-containing protein n=1 Tax=Thecamonas trahens ATCC 50062 TaxID=461836 RepID=A0A0L0DQ80_THETB|nr:hypothetical protein AMSG_09967 [Thecamonas trahens ATCC 50062]KNC54181.1 hypothetical protein AMSG_09967 [Thecamonas trahens ATCC 50062]|eukprot:XP_013753997.1 hypothetical protein AMSG_09967 [Thecamonas trahens ATCC 50062]